MYELYMYIIIADPSTVRKKSINNDGVETAGRAKYLHSISIIVLGTTWQQRYSRNREINMCEWETRKEPKCIRIIDVCTNVIL